ncbi:MAG: hypothetical protein AB8F95_12240 [Bacteroidia bacterium]
MKYQLSRTCGDCEYIDFFDLTKIEAAFDLYDHAAIWKSPCTQCGSEKANALGLNKPDFDKALLDLWGNDPKLFFMSQDEDLLLAEIEYLPLLLQTIDEDKYLEHKIHILVGALCILLYDHTVAPEEYTEQENKEREEIAQKVRPELIKRKRKIIEASAWIGDYVKKVVFPQIGIRTLMK